MKRFFRCDDGGCDWFVVAVDLDDAKRRLQETGVEFGTDREVTWHELTAEEVSARKRCHRNNANAEIVALADAEIGEVFCSEW
jgi:hypothetical protein